MQMGRTEINEFGIDKPTRMIREQWMEGPEGEGADVLPKIEEENITFGSFFG